METAQQIRNRIKSISSTRQITQSMRLVSTSKVKKAQTRLDQSREFIAQAEMTASIICRDAGIEPHPYLRGGKSEVAGLIAISGDRGLCGGYNQNAGKKFLELIEEKKQVKVLTVGSKARDFIRRRLGRSAVDVALTGISENPFFQDALEITLQVLDWYDSGQIGQLWMVYTKFESMLSYYPVARRLLPYPTQEHQSPEGYIRIEPPGAERIDGAVSFYIAAAVFGAILESSVCEQSARIASMDSAATNSDEMIRKLSLKYNQARQGAITQELIEIVGGADASDGN